MLRVNKYNWLNRKFWVPPDYANRYVEGDFTVYYYDKFNNNRESSYHAYKLDCQKETNGMTYYRAFLSNGYVATFAVHWAKDFSGYGRPSGHPDDELYGYGDVFAVYVRSITNNQFGDAINSFGNDVDYSGSSYGEPVLSYLDNNGLIYGCNIQLFDISILTNDYTIGYDKSKPYFFYSVPNNAFFVSNIRHNNGIIGSYTLPYNISVFDDGDYSITYIERKFSLLPNVKRILGRTDSFSIKGVREYLTFYNFNGNSRLLDKSYNLINSLEIEGKYRSSFEVLNPVINLYYSGVFSYNYVYIPRFNRYYFITNIISLSNNMWEITCKVDPLYTYKDLILLQKGFISRNEFDYNKFKVDDALPLSVEVNTNLEVGSIFGYDILDRDKETPSYVMLFTTSSSRNDVFVGTDVLGSSTYNMYILNYYSVQGVKSKMTDPKFTEAVAYMFGGDPTQGIIDIQFYPINFSTIYTEENELQSVTIENGNYVIPIPYGTDLTIAANEYNYIRRVVSNRIVTFESGVYFVDCNSFLDYPPYSRHIFEIPYYGDYEVDSRCVGKWVKFRYILNFDSATADIDIIANEDVLFPEHLNVYVDHLNCNIGRNIALTRTGALERMQTTVKATAALAGNVIGFAVGSSIGGQVLNKTVESKELEIGDPKRDVLYLKDYQRLLSGAGSLFTNFASSLSSVSSVHSSSNSQSDIYPSYSGYAFRYKTVSIKTTFDDDFESELEFNHTYGRLLLATREFSSLRGLTVVGNVRLENFDKCLPAEVKEIEELLLSGVIFPD